MSTQNLIILNKVFIRCLCLMFLFPSTFLLATIYGHKTIPITLIVYKDLPV